MELLKKTRAQFSSMVRFAWIGIFFLVCNQIATAQQTTAGQTGAVQPKFESGTRTAPQFGGPDQVDNQIAEDEASVSRVVEERLLEPWFQWKKGIQEEHGLSFGVDYTTALLTADDSPAGAEDSATGGMVRFFGSWELAGRESGNTGAFVWKMEHRHKYSTIAPSAFGFNLGYAGIIEPPFSDQEFRWTNLYWRQRLLEGRVAMLGGFLDATDYVDVYALGSPWTGFLNFAFSTGTLTIPVPNDAALGAAAGAMLTDSIFFIGGIVDRNGDPRAPLEGFDTFFDESEYFTSMEVGWTPSHDRIYLDNVHVTCWHADERETAGEPRGWGLNLSVTRYLDNKWLPFLRAGYAEDGGSLMQKSVSAGFGYQPVPKGDLLGIGFNWGEPNEDTFGTGLRDQYTGEMFYRWQLTPQLAVTPDVQYLINPALNPLEDGIWVFGLRARLAL